MRVADLDAISAFAQNHGLVSVIDNTFATPINFRPAEHGFDLSLHSGTKYLNGHSDIVAGAVIGRQRLVAAVNHKLVHLGATLDPHACFLLHRGLKTLALRMRQQNRSAPGRGPIPRIPARRGPGQLSGPGVRSGPRPGRPALFRIRRHGQL